jgi:quinol monooxygenase YgiN
LRLPWLKYTIYFLLLNRLEDPIAIAVIAIWEPKPDSVDEVESLLLEMREGTRLEPGCLQYDLHRTEDSRFVLYERYTDADAIEHHHSTPHYQELVQGRGLALLKGREVTRCELL